MFTSSTEPSDKSVTRARVLDSMIDSVMQSMPSDATNVVIEILWEKVTINTVDELVPRAKISYSLQ